MAKYKRRYSRYREKRNWHYRQCRDEFLYLNPEKKKISITEKKHFIISFQKFMQGDDGLLF